MKISVIAMTVCALGLLSAGGCDNSGSLSCPAGATLCGSQCTNMQGDPDNCGACGTVCTHGSICDLGVCSSAGWDAGSPVDATAAPPSDARSDAPIESSTIADSGQEGQ